MSGSICVLTHQIKNCLVTGGKKGSYERIQPVLQVKSKRETSGQGGAVGRYTVPTCTTKRTITNLKTKNNHNCQKIELYESPITKELKKKHSSRSVGVVETGSWVERTHGKAAAGGPGRARQWLAEWVVPHLGSEKTGGTTQK